jgi:hypothetical protein
VYSNTKTNRDVIEQQLAIHRPLRKSALPHGCEVLRCRYGFSKASVVLAPILYADSGRTFRAPCSGKLLSQADAQCLTLCASSGNIMMLPYHVEEAPSVDDGAACPSKQPIYAVETPQASSGHTQVHFPAERPLYSPHVGSTECPARQPERSLAASPLHDKDTHRRADNSKGDEESAAACDTAVVGPAEGCTTSGTKGGRATGSFAAPEQCESARMESAGQAEREAAGGKAGHAPVENDVVCLLTDSDDDMPARTVATIAAWSAGRGKEEDAAQQKSAPPHVEHGAAQSAWDPELAAAPLTTGPEPQDVIYTPGTAQPAMHAPSLSDPDAVVAALKRSDHAGARELYMRQLSPRDKHMLKEKRFGRIIVHPARPDVHINLDMRCAVHCTAPPDYQRMLLEDVLLAWPNMDPAVQRPHSSAARSQISSGHPSSDAASTPLPAPLLKQRGQKAAQKRPAERPSADAKQRKQRARKPCKGGLQPGPQPAVAASNHDEGLRRLLYKPGNQKTAEQDKGNCKFHARTPEMHGDRQPECGKQRGPSTPKAALQACAMDRRQAAGNPCSSARPSAARKLETRQTGMPACSGSPNAWADDATPPGESEKHPDMPHQCCCKNVPNNCQDA